jgi:hypothetical protein
MKRILNLFVLGYLACGLVWAQGGTAQISGTVSDRSGAVLPGVQITATQTETGAERTSITNETGSYVLPNLPIGPYRLEAALPGFRTFAQSGIVLQVNASVAINPSLEVGQVSETIEVQANAAMVETRATGVGQVIDNAQILELPLVGRQVTDLVVLAGAAVQTGITANTGRSFPGVPQFSIAGGLNRGTSFTLDGASHNDFRSNFGLPMPFPDALQEFKVETSAVPAQYGFRSGGALNAVTKSGTNDFHGAAFWFVRNEKFNARNFFADVRDPLKRNQFGGTIGGPIKENKLFFFGAYQGTTTRQTPTGSTTSFVPTPAMIRGDFSRYNSPACGRNVSLPPPFQNNIVPESALSPGAVAAAKLLPVPEDECGTTRWGSPIKRDEHQLIGKADYQISNGHSMFWRYMGFWYDHAQPSNLVSNALVTQTPGQDNLFQSGTFGDTLTIGSSVVNSLRLGWNRQAVQRINPEYFDVADLGINAYRGVPKMININVAQAFIVGSRTSAPNNYNETNYQIADDLGVIKGNHQLSFGGNFLTAQSNSNSQTFTLGTWDFNGGLVGAGSPPLVDFMLGRLSQLEQGGPNWTYVRSKVLGIYAQDSWKARSNLTISAGLRWEPYLPQRFERDGFNYFDMDAFLRNERTSIYRNAPAGMFYPGDSQFHAGGNSSNPIERRFDKFAPRLGLSWDPLGDGKTVIRAAYGIFYETQAGEYFIAVGQGAPWAGKAAIQNVPFDDPWRNIAGGNPFPFEPNATAPYPPNGVYALAFPDTTPPYVQQWNVGLQRQVATDWLLSASYIGNQVTHLYGARELNPGVYIPGVADAAGRCNTTLNGQPVFARVTAGATCSTAGNVQARRMLTLLDPDGSRGAAKYGYIAVWDDSGTRSYNGMLLSVNKRMSRNYSVTANYTWSHCIGHPVNNLLQGTAGAGVFNDPANRDYDRGNCGDQDIRHIANATTVVSMPRFSSTWMQRVAGNWRLSGILRAQSGEHTQALITSDAALTGVNVRSQRANVLSPDVYGNQCTTDLRAQTPTCRWFNASAFGTPANGTLGNAGMGALVGPGRWTIDAGLSRTFDITERHRLEFRAEANNVLNHTNFDNPTNTLGATFGRITSADDPRVMQFAVKYIF